MSHVASFGRLNWTCCQACVCLFGCPFRLISSTVNRYAIQHRLGCVLAVVALVLIVCAGCLLALQAPFCSRSLLTLWARRHVLQQLACCQAQAGGNGSIAMAEVPTANCECIRTAGACFLAASCAAEACIREIHVELHRDVHTRQPCGFHRVWCCQHVGLTPSILQIGRAHV